ncbi:ABC transporter permease [Agromyces mediolanus]|uniref:ABC transporter permease n=1 Tax=Agromyces mediolanus TaxID=41986 RepID=A0A918CBU6_AGRME|nr:ABC transporter permease subunit [Agromyces mediolanus]GGR14806.1 ABC transporter permease [Agromyces mediolanus]GLJ73132.1 ABC transporter permease [Agromyces mediolanus]
MTATALATGRPVATAGARTRRLVWGWRLALVLLLAGLWELSRAPWSPAAELLPPLADIGVALAGLPLRAETWAAVGATLGAALTGLAIAGVLGVALGTLLGLLPAVARATRLLVELARAMPVFGLLPVCILLLGTGFPLTVVIVVTACVWPFLVQTRLGVAGLHPQLRDVVRAYRVPRPLVVRRVLLPQALPMIGTGLRIALAMAVVVTIGTETIIQSTGLGERIAIAERSGAMALMFAYVLLAALLGLACNVLAVAAERSLTRWRPAEVG